MAVDGDVSGGNVSLSGQLSFERKEDWVYILGNVSMSANTVSDIGDTLTQVNTGPLIPTLPGTTNPSFSIGGQSRIIVNNAISVSQLVDGGADPRAGMPIFGDKRLSGAFLMIAGATEANIDGATYQLSAWGWLVNYSSFFRNVNPIVG